MNKNYLNKNKYPLLRLLSYLSSHRKDYLLASLYSFLNKLFDIFPEILIGGTVDIVVNRKNSWLAHSFNIVDIHKQIIILGVLTFSIWCFESLFQYLYNLKWRNLAQTVEHKLRMDCYQHIQQATLPIIEQKQSGHLIATLNDDINQLERFLEDGINQIIQITASTLLIGVVFFYCSPLITLFAILPVPFILLGAFYFQNKLEDRFLDVRQRAANISAALNQNIMGLATIKSFTAQAFESKKIEHLSKQYQLANKNTIKVSAMVTPVIRIVILCGFLSTLLIGGMQTISGQMNVGIFSVLVFLSQRLLWPFSSLADVTVNYQRAMASTSRALNLLTWQTEDSNGELNKLEVNGNITISNLKFSYPQSKVMLFNGLNLEIEKNATIAFVGESGSGKSSLIKILTRFYQPDDGCIKYGKVNIEDFELQFWRQQISLVSQEVHLFPGTISENIAYGQLNVSIDDINNVVELAGATNFINDLEHGLDTQLNEGASNLSGGQRQRIIIARALLKSSPILVFDEATSAVDNDTELAIQESLQAIAHQRTIILIAHRLSTVRHADQIFVLDKGRIIEHGSHEELLSKQGTYHRLWSIQSGTYTQAT